MQFFRRAAFTRATIPTAPRSVLLAPRPLPRNRAPTQVRLFATKKAVDDKIEEIQDQYGTAKDEFEIATEETENNTVYAEDDRKAAREELDKLHEIYKGAVEGPDQELGEKVRQRVGQRIRELDNAVKNLEELAMNQD